MSKSTGSWVDRPYRVRAVCEIRGMKITVGLAQFAPCLGDVDSNLNRVLDLIEQAQAQQVDLLVFPELALTGYSLKDLVPDVAIHATPDDPSFKMLLQASSALDLVVSFAEQDDRFRWYIAAAYLSAGRLVHLHRKVYLPTYRMFDEARFFAAGDSFCAFDTRWGRMGLMVCEDAWHLSTPYVLWEDGADFLIDIAAGPGYGISADTDLASAASTRALLGVYAELTTAFVIFCNRVGLEDGVTFPGGSCIVGPDGRTIAAAPLFEQVLITGEIDTDGLRRSRVHLPLLRDEKSQLVREHLERIANRKREERK